ncbi:MAG: hypothetical protein P8M72_09345 [Gammaproteobacteria bacterium]|nr:hypothetical protein [Gammaproteobacteria bacterium]
MEELLAEAKTLVMQYDDYVQEQNLAAIMASLCEDDHFEILQRSPITGKETIGEFYESNFSEGGFSFKVEITDEKTVSDIVFIGGVMNRIHTPEGQSSESIKMNFSFALKKEDGRLKIWQCRFAH